MPKPKRRSEDDEESILRVLKDGERMHFSMMAKDSGGEVLPARDAATSPLRVVDAFGNSGLALNKPGARYLTADAGTPARAALVMRDHQRQEARDLYVTELQDAWRSTGTNDRGVARIHNTGDAVRDAYLDQKHDLENSWHRGSGKRSQDSAPAGPVYDAVEGQRVKDEAYRAMINELTTAWQRKP
jgi:hypothetical protein